LRYEVLRVNSFVGNSSYPESNGTWRFPGIGEFQCYHKVKNHFQCYITIRQLKIYGFVMTMTTSQMSQSTKYLQMNFPLFLISNLFIFSLIEDDKCVSYCC